MKKVLLLLLTGLASCSTVIQNSENIHSDSLEYLTPHCLYGPLLEAVQVNQVFPDGKTFVDAIPLQSPEDIIRIYQQTKNNPDFNLKGFVLDHFKIPQPIQSHPRETFPPISIHLDSLWNILLRKPDTTLGSRIGLPNPYIVPGGRFTEIYYWDSYFTMLGLGESNRVAVIEDMIDNFCWLIDKFGFIPNGSRTYFLGRSQPPFFSLMVTLLVSLKGEHLWKKYLPYLVKEYSFWMEGEEKLSPTQAAFKRVVRMDKNTILNRYWDNFEGPRDESFLEDQITASKTKEPANKTFKNLRAGAESGWDFSSRWLEDGIHLETINTTNIVPVDLNALLYHLEMSIAKANNYVKNVTQANHFLKKATARQKAIQQFCWSKSTNFFCDYNITKQSPTNRLSLAGLFPLCFHLADTTMAKAVATKIEKHFLKPGGVVTTLHETGQQWDAPNGWAPLQWMTIWGLENYGFDSLADKIKHRWLRLNHKVYQNTGKMMEKYNVQDTTLSAGGGEYPVQDGFGWTNGVYLKLLSN